MTWSPTATDPDSTVPVTTVPTPVKREAAIDREAEASQCGARRNALRGGEQLVPQRVDALTTDDRDRDDFGACEPGAGERPGDVLGHLGAPRRRHQVDLGQRHDAAGDAEQVDDREVLDASAA